MGVLIVFLLALIVVGVTLYPLLPGRRTAYQLAAGVTDEEIERALREVRRLQAGPACPGCELLYQPGDRFCVRCGTALPQVISPIAGPACPSCGARLRDGDQFCAKCGRPFHSGEVA